MGVINPEHLLEQAKQLIIPPPAGPPRQVDLRRAVSAAYYAVFHFTLTELADEFVSKTKRTDKRYTLVYRHLNHRALRALCAEVARTALSPRIANVAPASGFGPDIAAFAVMVAELQEKRHRSDYNPSIRLKTSDAKLAIKAAYRAIEQFSRASRDRRRTFLTLLLCPPR